MSIFRKGKPLFDSSANQHFTNKYRLAEKDVTCPHCGHNEFDQAIALLNTPGMTFMGLDWANRTATVLSCRKCGKIEWFLRAPEEIR